jgi:hypothetical protein
MRRTIVSTLGLVLLAAVVGCKTHGVCDCDVHQIYEGPLPPAAGIPGTIHGHAGPVDAHDGLVMSHTE